MSRTLFGGNLAPLIEGGFLTLDAERLAATAAGRQRLNAVLGALLARRATRCSDSRESWKLCGAGLTTIVALRLDFEHREAALHQTVAG